MIDQNNSRPVSLTKTQLPRGRNWHAVGHSHPGFESYQGLVVKVRHLLDALRDEFGLVIVDLPTVEEIGGHLSLASQLDGVLLVVAAECVTPAEARRAVEQLHRGGMRLLGAVLNAHRQYLPDWLCRRL